MELSGHVRYVELQQEEEEEEQVEEEKIRENLIVVEILDTEWNVINQISTFSVAPLVISPEVRWLYFCPREGARERE